MANGRTTALSTWAFAPHYVWKDQFSFAWTEIEGWWCLFAEYVDGLYMPLPPLGPGSASGNALGFDAVVSQVMEFMRSKNFGSSVTRIENVPSELAASFEGMGYTVRTKDAEYLYRREDIAKLEGDRYKSPRHAYNRFLQNGRIRYEPYGTGDRVECRELFHRWSGQKEKQYAGACRDGFGIERFMLQDAESAHRIIMECSESLDLTGRVVRVHGAMCAYTFGFRRSSDVFCVLVEVTDRTIVGASHYVFREFCRELEPYTFINTMDDSGLPSLARSKQAYAPVERVQNYIVTP
ncbi:MAG: phosphatidylglycerol lysyltransferase domain-containing protein [Nitrospirales bacterium]|nr:DUF2156 domain-containing protein [Nitrospira sp.]MDR4501101.1 phosphatidylglycerol lysyltransferase domain-containing protein [Nitrospirales bacterium]